MLLEAKERFFVTKDWISIIFLIILILFVVLKTIDYKRLYKLYSLTISKNYLVLYQKQTPMLLNSFHTIFGIIQLLTLSLIIFVSIQAFNSIPRELEFTYFLSIITGVFIVYVLRYFVGKGLAILFEIERDFEYTSFMKVSYLGVFSLLIIPVLLFVLYSNLNSVNLSFLVLILSGLLLLIYYMLIISSNEKLILSKLFYFILYICALEIAPLILLYKLFVQN